MSAPAYHPAITATGSVAGALQAWRGISQTITVLDTRRSVKLHVPVFHIPVTGTWRSPFMARFPESAGDSDRHRSMPPHSVAFSFPNISIVLPNIGINLGSGPDPQSISPWHRQDLLPIKIPLIDIPAAPGFETFDDRPSSEFFQRRYRYPCGRWRGNNSSEAFFSLTSGSSESRASNRRADLGGFAPVTCLRRLSSTSTRRLSMPANLSGGGMSVLRSPASSTTRSSTSGLAT